MDDRLIGVRRKISNLPLMEDCKFGFYMLVNNIELSDKKIKTFLKIKLNKVAIGFLYRLLVSSAYKYGVPKVYIDKCISAKDNYNISKSYTSTAGKEASSHRKSEMRREFSDLMTATLGLIKQKNSRKEKISKVLEKIADKNN
jgi:hypothetical protein